MVSVRQEKSRQDSIAEEIARRLVEQLQPDRIYLFGSRSRGDFRKTSDYDFLAIVPDGTPPEARRVRHDIGKMGEEYVAVDVKIYTRSRFDRQLHLEASMPSTVLREGKLLYARGAYVPASAKGKGEGTLAVLEGAGRAEDEVLVENTRDWLRKAKNDLSAATLLACDSPELNDESLFHSQQAVEKAVKAFLVWNDKPGTKIHDLRELCADCIALDRSLEPVLQRSYDLAVWCTAGRYPGEAPDTSITEAQDGLAIARAVVEAIVQRLPASLE
jgi:HEPN domain-containing protein/predicted nucleotidyltransferase